MAYTALSFTALEIPDVNKWNTIGDNFADHETRLLLTDEQCGFFAYSTIGSIQTATTTSAVCKYETAEFNIGSNYDTALYTFTAPVTGIYSFQHQIYIDALGAGSGFEIAYAELYVNGVEKRGSIVREENASSSSDPMATLSTVLYLTAGDTVKPYVKLSTGTNLLLGGDQSDSNFSGFLVKQTV